MYSTFPKKEYVDRLKKLRELMSKNSFDALLLTDTLNVTYFTGYPTVRPGEGCAILPLEGEPTLITAVIESGNAEKTFWFGNKEYYKLEDCPWAGPDVPNNPLPLIKKTLEKLGNKPRIGMEPGFEAVKQKLKDFTISDAADIIWKLRMIKTDAEIEVIRNICKATCEAETASFESLRPGMTEREFLKIVYLNLVEKSGGFPPAFALLRSGPQNCRMINAVGNNKIIKKGELVLLDAGTTYYEYPADVLRMACMGKPNAKQKKLVELQLKSEQACIDIIKPGIKASDVFNAGKSVFENAGVKKGSYLEYSGHGLGLGGYNPPILNGINETTIEEGMVFCVEPQCWDAPYMKSPTIDVVVEDTVVVTKKGHDFLTDPETRELFVVE